MSFAAGASGIAQTNAMNSKLTAYKHIPSTRATRTVTAMAGSGKFFVGGEWGKIKVKLMPFSVSISKMRLTNTLMNRRQLEMQRHSRCNCGIGQGSQPR